MIARYQDLCIDAADAAEMTRFWSELLGLQVGRVAPPARLTGPTPQHTVWINQVPEPVTVKQRVHIDVHSAGVESAVALGASVQTAHDHWTTMRDPEGGEFCVFQRETVPDYRLYEIGIDCTDAESIARWWADVLGGTLGHGSDNSLWWVENVPGMPFESMDFVVVPEPKTVKNRIHWDVRTDDVALLAAAGATVLRERGGDIEWTIMADPEGNEFCAFTD
jgi:catechol 2,3-dioxygenase-like lactoylglutathione lyase family enzyme